MTAPPRRITTLDDVRRVVSAHRATKRPHLGRASAVLVPIFERGGELHLLLTERAAHLPHHPGQLAFPGGKCEPHDASAAQTALREAQEELGLAPSLVTILGELDDCPTLTSRFVVTPVVASIPDRAPIAPHAGEVARVVELPLSAFLAPGAHASGRGERDGEPIPLHTFTLGAETVFGATARILHQLLTVLGHTLEGDR